MIPSKLTRAAHRASTAPSTTACLSCLATARPSHQRRQSSSKASSWPGDNTSKPAPAAKATAAEDGSSEQQPVSGRPPSRGAKSRARGTNGGYRRVPSEKKAAAIVPAEPVDQFAALPSVPSVQTMNDSDRGLSNFFSLHRPMSLAQSLPPPATQETFHSIFESAHPAQDPWANGNSAERRPEDVVYALHTTFETIDSNTAADEEGNVRWEVVHDSNQPQLKSLEELVAQFKPFRAPPAPTPFPEYAEQKKKAAGKSTALKTKPKQKQYQTMVTVTVSTDAEGEDTISASTSPFVQLPDASEQQQKVLDASTIDTQAVSSTTTTEWVSPSTRRAKDFVEHYHLMQDPGLRRIPPFGQRSRVKMFLISVKRQRKLKMKKHKYKKLMKRTRNLRRRLERK